MGYVYQEHRVLKLAGHMFLKHLRTCFAEAGLLRRSQCRGFHSTPAQHQNDQGYDYAIVVPGKVSATRVVPGEIARPPYITQSWLSAVINNSVPKVAEIKSERQIQAMRMACALARDVLCVAGESVRSGMTTDELDAIVHGACIDRGAYPSPLLYRGYPKSVCTSINNVACHGIPDDRPLEDRDILNIDVTVFYGGFHGDTSATFQVGKDIDAEAGEVMKVAKLCRDEAISQCGPGVELSVIGQVINRIAETNNFRVIPDFCGHGIGEYFHGPPDIYHIPYPCEGRMEAGMTFTIEPILTTGSPEIKILSDGWTAVTLDGSRSAQYEHTILITEHGVEVLTD